MEDGYLEKSEIPWDTDGYKPATNDFIDGIEYDAKDPLDTSNRTKSVISSEAATERRKTVG